MQITSLPAAEAEVDKIANANPAAARDTKHFPMFLSFVCFDCPFAVKVNSEQ
jgi:hypothetical protein